MSPPQASKSSTIDDESWLQDELLQLFAQLTRKIAGVVGDTGREVDQLSASGLEDTFIERSSRDVKAHGFDRIVDLLDEIILDEHL